MTDGGPDTPQEAAQLLAGRGLRKTGQRLLMHSRLLQKTRPCLGTGAEQIETGGRVPPVVPGPLMKSLLLAPLPSLFILSAIAAPPADPGNAPEILGFGAAHARDEAAIEGRFDAQLKPDDQRAWLKRMSSEPNHVGSPHDKANAEFMLGLFREWGWDARIETFQVLYPTPVKVALELTGPTPFAASLREPPVPGDGTSGVPGCLPPYAVYGADGDVTAELVYVNQGMPDDYEQLDREGISVRGRIVIARYGGGWRGLKPKLAAQHGAVGCIIYSDPRDDGYGAGDTYPKGGYRPADGVQRGSVADMPIYPGDPLTPGIGATPEAMRLPIDQARTILKIPVIPISYADAQPLLASIGGPVAPESWRGALPITYHMGPGPGKGASSGPSDWGLKPIYDVIAVLKGSEFPNEWVMRGNHHDGWVFGAWDPLSGNAALMAEAKAIGALAREGWRPKRTLVYASWDGEEPGLLGSTEWCETHEAELREKLVLYVNADTNSRGFLEVGGSHSLQFAANQVAAAVRDPDTGRPVLSRVRAKILVDAAGKGAEEQERRAARLLWAGGQPPIRALGSGSDFTPFLQHLGIASLNIEYGGEDEQAGAYHSTYDTFEHLRVSATRGSPTAWRWRRRSGGWSFARRTPTSCRCASRRSPRPSDATPRRSTIWPTRGGRPSQRGTG